MIYRFDGFELDAEKFELRRDGAPVALEPQVFSLLQLLIENAGRMVSKDEIIEKIWQSRAISDAAVTSRISAARNALGDDGKTQRYIRTVHGRGLLFTGQPTSDSPAAAEEPEAATSETPEATAQAPQQQLDPPRRRTWAIPAIATGLALIAGLGWLFTAGPLGTAPNQPAASPERMAYPLPDRPSIAVMPFDDLSPDESPHLIAEAITKDIIADLSRFRDFVVIASNSTFSYQDKPVKTQQVAEDLGVRYILEGTLQTQGEKLRINVQLIDALNGSHVWTDQFEGEIENTFDLQDEITGNVVSNLGGLDGRIARNDLRLAKAKGTENLTAYENLLLGIELRHQFTPEKNVQAREHCQRAVELDPGFSRAHVCLGFTHYLDRLYGWSDDPQSSIDQGFELARKAVQLDPLEEDAHWAMANMHWVAGQHQQAIRSYHRAMELNPNNADILSEWGWNMVFLTGDADQAVANIKRAMRLNPFHDDWYEQGLGVAAYAAGQYEEAIAALELVTYHAIDSRVAYAASLAQLGRLDEAKEQVAHIARLEPDFAIPQWIERQSFYLQETADHFTQGMRKAGLDEVSS